MYSDNMKVLMAKALSSRKFMVMFLALAGKVLTPVAAKYNIDLTPVGNAIQEYSPVLIVWLLGQSAVDAAQMLKSNTPTVISTVSSSPATATATTVSGTNN